MTTHQTHPDRVAGRNRDGFLRLALKLDAAASGAVGDQDARPERWLVRGRYKGG